MPDIPRNWQKIPRKLAGTAMRAIQSAPPYRRVARLFSGIVRIEVAQRRDMPKLQMLLGERNARSLERAGTSTFVARIGSGIAGYVQLTRIDAPEHAYRGFWLFNLNVLPLFKGAGIGTRLVETALREAERQAACRLNLIVDIENKPALALYRKSGFRPASIPGVEALLHERKRKTGRSQIILSKPV